MPSTMTREQAQMFRAAYEGAVKRYRKMTKVQLRNEDLIALSETGMQRVYGGPVSKDELITDILNLRGYTTAKLNEATHAQYHDVTWPGCQFCQDRREHEICVRCGWPAPYDTEAGEYQHADVRVCEVSRVS